MTASVFLFHHFLLIFVTQLIEIKVFFILERVLSLSQLSKVLNMNFACGKLHFLTT